MMRSIESASSVFYHSQEEEAGKTGVDSQGSHEEAPSGTLHDSYQDSVTVSGLVITEPDFTGKNCMFDRADFSLFVKCVL